MTEGSLGAMAVILLGITVAFLGVRFAIGMIRRRLLVVSGIAYLMLGVLLGPASPAIPAVDQLGPLAPVIALVVGWIGLLAGVQLDLRQLVRARDGTTRLAFLESAGAGLAVALVARWVLSSGLVEDVSPEQAWLAAGVMGCTAATGSRSALDLLTGRFRLEGGLADVLGRARSLADLLAILVFGVLLCVIHQGETAPAQAVSPTEWAVLSVGIGAGLGLLSTLLMGRGEPEEARFMGVIGLAVFASGAAFVLQLSPLLVNLTAGVVLVNTARQGGQVRDTLSGTRREVSLVLLVIAGALWTVPPAGPAVLAAVGYLGLRLGGKVVGAWAGTVGTAVRPGLVRGLVAQGDVAVAMAVSYRLVDDGVAADLAYTAILVSVIVCELAAPSLLKGLLLDEGQLRAEVAAVGES